ncbi:MAG: nucleotidyltransferase family protein [Nanoarchaeota archaeon]|nr:nucleotidyltransferase family protein [Nanoarchaeota archaeon]MBU4300139.1 nucleotidyltransferase family protein [Nanoarchaeota archaeon]MBU4451577.1 nucleotidyltransferase family protein [Nanoarchaeota archaeon]MCG2724345.1 nucleotidyltransferase family protein [archaeon]
MDKKIQDIKAQLVPILKQNNVLKAGIFGSFARGEQKKSSDIDILIKFKEGKSLLDLARLELMLEKKLGRKVDLITYDSLHPLIKDKILKEEIQVI